LQGMKILRAPSVPKMLPHLPNSPADQMVFVHVTHMPAWETIQLETIGPLIKK